MRKLTQSSLIYWIYCIVNKYYGQGAIIKRSDLRRYYTVNSGDLTILDTNHGKDLLELTLKLMGFKAGSNYFGSDCVYKVIGDKVAYIYVRRGETINRKLSQTFTTNLSCGVDNLKSIEKFL